jgi:uncharacterized protein DUF3291
VIGMTALPARIAQYNFARARAELDDPVMAGFVTALNAINELADNSPGFVWRLQTEKGDATDIRPYADPLMLVTLSVWESVEDLRRYVYHADHAWYLRRRADWFEHPQGRYLVLWWVPDGHIPDVSEGKDRLEWLARHGSTAHAFDFRTVFPAPGDLGPERQAVPWKEHEK